MKNKKTLIVSILLIAAISITAYFICHNLEKRLYFFSSEVKTSVNEATDFLQASYKHNIETLEKCKSGALSAENKNDLYQAIIKDGQCSWTGTEFLQLITSLHENGKNEQELRAIRDDYSKQVHKATDFFIFHKNFADLQNRDADTLISYFKNLKLITERIGKIKIEP